MSKVAVKSVRNYPDEIYISAKRVPDQNMAPALIEALLSDEMQVEKIDQMIDAILNTSLLYKASPDQLTRLKKELYNWISSRSEWRE